MGIAGFFSRHFSWLHVSTLHDSGLHAGSPHHRKQRKQFSFDQSLSLAYTPLERMLCKVANDDTPTPIPRPANDSARPTSRDRR
ncbi:MAG: hypothetical protein R3C51_10900 [Parvularculaceae bacterium]